MGLTDSVANAARKSAQETELPKFKAENLAFQAWQSGFQHRQTSCKNTASSHYQTKAMPKEPRREPPKETQATPQPDFSPAWTTMQLVALKTMQSYGAEIDSSASIQEIKSAYKRLALKFHPDMYDGSDTHFIAVNQAYKELTTDVVETTAQAA